MRLAAPARAAAAALLLAATLPAAAQPAQAAAACRPDPLNGRALYLRGGFNAWAAPEAQRFTWLCNRWELVARLSGEHRFKLGDEGWSADADFGSADGRRLVRKGPELQRRFGGTYRFTVTMADPDTPELRIDECPAGEPPLGATALFLRGTPNNWAALDDYQFHFSCDAYYLNVRLQGRHEFKIADAAWADASTIGPGGFGRGAGFAHTFSGEHTLRLAWAGGRPQLDIGPRSWADPRAAAVTDPVALSLRFDSRSAAHKRPFGAVPAGTEVAFALTAAPGVQRATLVVERRRLEGNQELLEYLPAARVPMARTAGPGGRERFSASHRFADAAVWGYWFEVEIGGRLFAYQNNAQALHWTREKGTGGPGAVAERPANPGGIRRFRQTVHAPDLRVPDWAADVVWYYVFPERFRNGDPSNDPRPGVARFRDATVERHARWLERPFRPGSGDGSDALFNNDFFGGDLQGLIDKLDHIRELGANTLYLTPIFRAASNHKYDHADYHQVDPGFGSNADFERLAREAAARGMRVVLDASLNHTGSDSIYFDRYGHHGGAGAFTGGRHNPGSPYARWYRIDPAPADPAHPYRGWVGNHDLPELDKSDPGFRRFAYGGAPAAAGAAGAAGHGAPGAPRGVMQTWLDRGASGWRMDVAPWVPDDFWREWRAAVKAHRPDALTVAETWFDASKYFLGDMFDSTMNYVFRNAVLDHAAGGPATALVAQLEHLREAYPAPAHAALMNLLSSHDQARSLHLLGWPDGSTDAQARALAKARLLLAVFLQMTYPGAPAVYYGDEVGLNGGDDPFNREPYPWADEGGQPDLALREQFRRLIALRHAHPVLRRGAQFAPLHAGEHVLVQLRRLGPTWALVASNNAATPQRVAVRLPRAAPRRFADVLAADAALRPLPPAPGHAAPLRAAADGTLTLELPPRFGRVLVSLPPAGPR